MNRGALKGFAPAIGDYQGGTASGGSWGGNRGRLHDDEFRAFGNADGQKNWLNGGGAARVINTNCQQGISGTNVFFPGDLGMIFNGVSGTIIQASGIPPFGAVYNSAGRIRCAVNSSITTVFENNTIVDNVPGLAVQLMGLEGIVSGTTYLANGAACTMPTGPVNDINSGVSVGTFNGGTLTGSANNYVAAAIIGTGATLTQRSSYLVKDAAGNGGISGLITAGSGAITNQYGLDVPILVFGSTINTAIRIGAGGQTLTALPQAATIGQIDVYSGTTTLNFASCSMPPVVSFRGTLSLSQSAQAFGLITMFNASPTITNTVGSSANFGPVLGLAYGPTFTANTQTGLSGGTHTGYLFGPTTSVLNSGTLTSISFVGMQTTGTYGTGTTVTAFTGALFSAPTVTGTLTSWIGVDIAAVTGATTNIGIRNASSLRQQGAFIATNNAVSVTSNAGTVAVTNYLSTFTNSSAATMAITMAVTGAVDGQKAIVRIYDFSAAAETIGWTNTENGGAAVPLTSNGSTTLPLTVGFIFNGQTTKWRCVASV